MNAQTKGFSAWLKITKNRDRLQTFVFGLIAVVVFIAVWALAADFLDIVYLPGPLQVFDAFITSFSQPDPSMGTTMWQNIWASLQRFLYGFLIAFIVAVPLGLVMGFSRKIELLTKPIVEIFRPIPPIAWVSLFLIALGLFWGPIVVIFIGVFFPLLSNIIFGVKSVDRYLIDAAKTLGAKRLQVFIKVIFPATVPYIMTGITIGLGIGWMCIVAAEMVSVFGGGVGYYIYINGQIGRFASMYGGMVVIAILGIITVGLSRFAENRLSKQMGMK